MLAAIPAACICVTAAMPASAAASTDTITAVSSSAYSGASGDGGEFLVDAGSVPAFFNADPNAPHNVVSKLDGPDGQRLFQTPLIDEGESLGVAGTEYLQPGPYDFLCSIHSTMTGRLHVSGSGAVPRPSVDVAIISSKLAKARRGKLKVSVSAATASADINLGAKLGAKPLAGASGIDLAAGQATTLTLTLKNKARKLLEDLDKAKVKLTATVPFGAPDAAKRTLK